MSSSISLKSSGNFKKTMEFLKRVKEKDFYKVLDQYGQLGVEALSQATPKETGRTASSWTYHINLQKGANGYNVELSWHNSNVTKDGVPVVILLRYGHGTSNGGFIQGNDFITPAIAPIFDKIKESVWMEVTK